MTLYEKISAISQIVLGISGLVALSQIWLFRKVSKTDSQRESIKYSSELVAVYLKDIIPLINIALDKLFKEKKYSYFKGDKLNDFFWEELQESPKRKKHMETLSSSGALCSHMEILVNSTLNQTESFATPFISKVADEEIAFQALGRTYCETVEGFYPFYCLIRNRKDYVPYLNNTILLYKLWSARLETLGLEKIQLDAEIALLKIHKESLRPIGT